MIEVRSRGRVRWMLALALVLAYQAYAGQGLLGLVDLHASDECAYHANGSAVLAGEGNWRELVAWSGPYQLVHGAIGAFRGPAASQDVARVLLATASTAALLYALSAVASAAAATAFGFLWASGCLYLGAGGGSNGVYLLGVALAFLAAGRLVRGRVASGAGLALLAAATRPELAAWFFGAGVAAALLGRARAGVALAAAIGLLVAAQVLVDDADRSGTAFRQHYAHGAARAGLVPDGASSLAAADRRRAYAGGVLLLEREER